MGNPAESSISAIDGDAYAGAKASLRDTIKWVAAAFAALAAAVLAGGPLTGLGSLPPGSRLALAVLGAAIGLVCTFCAIWVALKFLAWKPFFLSELEHHEALCALINEHAGDILPPETPDVRSFLAARVGAINEIRTTAATPYDPAYTRAVARFLSIDTTSRNLTNFVHYELLRRSLVVKARSLFALAIGAAVGLGLFAWAANPTKEKASTGQTSQLEILPYGRGLECGEVGVLGQSFVRRERLVSRERMRSAPPPMMLAYVTVLARLNPLGPEPPSARGQDSYPARSAFSMVE